ncbi:MAG: 3' terminal RNA ribose 2'-O-methyltransferase Hen1, partial [Burkholderiales bacterium]|nr:3' terminal RNA ribose 2'-O-methyltransferase Hen1 [Anaerolineae bacterium]
MLLTITTTYQPATDLGYLLAKHPARVQAFNLAFGQAHVFYPEATDERCTAALLLDVDPVGLVRREGGGVSLEQYVNDRPYAASSFMSVAIAQVYRSGLSGTCKERPELAVMPIPLEAKITALPCRGGEKLLRELFEPLGYTVTAEHYALDAAFPAWGESAYFTVTLTVTTRLQDLLSHLYVLIPVLDDKKHYFVSDDEVSKLLRHGEGWLKDHPALELITSRYLRRQRGLMREALAQLVEAETPQVEETAIRNDAEEAAVEE